METLRAKKTLDKRTKEIKKMAEELAKRCSMNQYSKYSITKKYNYTNGIIEVEYYQYTEYELKKSRGVRIKVCESTVFEYDYRVGLITIADGEWVELLKVLYSKISELEAEKNKKLEEQDYNLKCKKRSFEIFEYILYCKRERMPVYRFIIDQLKNKGLRLEAGKTSENSHMGFMKILYKGNNGQYKGNEGIVVEVTDSDSFWKVTEFNNGEWFNTFVAVIQAVQENEAEIINTSINSRVEAAIMKLTPDKK